jgi:hypothetical protein
MPIRDTAGGLELLYPHLSAVQVLFLFFLACLALLAVQFLLVFDLILFCLSWRPWRLGG